MFSWFRKKSKPVEAPAPPRPSAPERVEDADDGAAPSFGTKVRVAFANAQRTWEEETDLVAVLARTLALSGHPVTSGDDHVVHADSGIVLRPALGGFEPLDNGGVRTVTIVRASHPAFRTDGP